MLSYWLVMKLMEHSMEQYLQVILMIGMLLQQKYNLV